MPDFWQLLPHVFARDPHLPGQDIPRAHLFIWPDVFDDYNGGDVPGAHDAQKAAKK